ncbi:MAG: GAF domain-containing protein [Deltaproteobacteria bacterium]|nr:GAF domain-containing protein [Deltaproteobacteria bacterium]
MEKETSCINSRAILDYVKEYNNGDYFDIIWNLDPEIDVLPDPESFLRDPNNWISCTVVSKLLERARLILKDEMTAFKIAKYAVEKTSLGYAQGIIVKALWSYKQALKNLQKLNDKWNKSKKVELVKIYRNEAIVRLYWDHQMDITKDMCLYNQGAYTFMPLIWGGKPLILKEECCYLEGAAYCEYHLKWPAKNRFHEILSRFFTSKSVLMETIMEMEEDKKVIEQKYEEVNQLNVELNQKIRQLLAIQETGKAIVSVLELNPLLTVIMNILSSVCKINRALIMLVNEEDGYLEYKHGVGFDGDVPEEVKNYRVPLGRVSNILTRVTNTGRPEYVPEVKSSSLRKENIVLTHGKPISLFVVPLITRSKVIGVIATDAVDGIGVPKETRETLEIFAPQIAIAIENARLYRKLQDQMEALKRSHALLSRAEKFSFLGNLAARLAHEIKNPMTAIGTFLQMLPQKFNDEEFRTNFYKIAMEETTRVNNLITELLDLINTRESHFDLNNLHDLIDKMIFLISPQSKAKDIEIVRNFDSSIGQVKIDSEKMKQVILNLLSNAVDFTPEKGRIEISTAKESMNGSKESIRVEIKDNGIGIHQSMMNRIFEPYFTTKYKSNMHNGTGLGLFIAHQNIQDHKGTINVQSEVNKGTTFILNLPTDPSVKLSGKANRYNS